MLVPSLPLACCRAICWVLEAGRTTPAKCIVSRGIAKAKLKRAMAASSCALSSLTPTSSSSVKWSKPASVATAKVQLAGAFSSSELFAGQLSASAVLPIKPRVVCVPATVCKISKGDTIPPVGLRDENGKLVNLSKFKGRPVVVYFYPRDDSPGCTKQACAFRDSYEKFKKAGAEVIGISDDTPESHKAFKAKYKLPYTLLSDEGNKLRKEWGVPSDFFGALPGRQTYVADKNGVIQLIFNNQFEPEKHIVEALNVLKA